MLIFFYFLLFAICSLLISSGKSFFMSLAFDSGGVTTGPITVPFIMALGVGIASSIGGRDANENSFGLVALCSVAGNKPIDNTTENTLRVVEADPSVKGNTATNAMKDAVLETGAKIQVPMFVNEGELIRIDTRTGEYMERVKGE